MQLLAPTTTGPAHPGSPVAFDLVEALLAKVRDQGSSGRAISRALGLDHSVLARVRRGQARLGLKACVSIAQTYPSLRQRAAAYLADRYDTDELALLAEAYQIALDRRRGR